MTGEIDSNKIRQRVKERLKKREEYLTHVGVFVIVNLGMWGLYIFTSSFMSFPWPLIVMFGWGIGLAIHTLDYLYGARREAAFEREFERELRREKLRVYGDPDYDERTKPKRREARLSDDGELEYTDEAESDGRKAKSR
jgi:hypothetical protein